MPVLFVIASVALLDFSGPFLFQYVLNSFPRNDSYTALYFLLYAADISLTVTAIRVLYVKTAYLVGSGAELAARRNARRNLRHLVMFSVAPSIMQIPYAIRQITNVVVGHNGLSEG